MDSINNYNSDTKSLLFCKNDVSCLVFDGLCDRQLKSIDNLNANDCFFVDDLSFHIKHDSSIFLHSFVFKDRANGNLDDVLLRNINILNDLLNTNFKIKKSSVIVRKDWLSKFGSNTLFKKYNIKKDYSMSGNLVEIPKTYECYIDKQCNIINHMKSLSLLFKSRLKIKLLSKNIKRRALMIKCNDTLIPDPSLFSIEPVR